MKTTKQTTVPLRIDFTVLLLGFCIALMLGITSCAANGYGCHGRGRIITRVR